jgi:hypothetical protein
VCFLVHFQRVPTHTLTHHNIVGAHEGKGGMKKMEMKENNFFQQICDSAAITLPVLVYFFSKLKNVFQIFHPVFGSGSGSSCVNASGSGFRKAKTAH